MNEQHNVKGLRELTNADLAGVNGGGFFDDVGDWFAGAAKSVANWADPANMDSFALFPALGRVGGAVMRTTGGLDFRPTPGGRAGI